IEKCHPIVCDGLTIGHPCCKVFRCPYPLEKSRDHHCEGHAEVLSNICAVEGCPNVIVPTTTTKKTCDDRTHQAMERKSLDRGRSMFVL
ncbi:hypothetical protein CONPUDRAFT_21539, partial [Coniophora puteana RWD-64-598 SS2]